MKETNIEKKNIYALILSVLIIWVHSINNGSFIQDFIGNKLCSFAVPGFFIIYGFLFFRNVNCIHDVFRKIIKRINTLLIPFFMWNAIYYLVFVIVKKGSILSFENFCNALVSYTYNPLFWYMYQLILLTALSVIIFYIIKNKLLSIVYLLILLCLIYFYVDIPQINEDALFYFSLGAIYAMHFEEKFLFYKNKNAVIFYISIYFISCLFRFLIAKYIFNGAILYNITLLSTVLMRTSAALVLWFFIDYLKLKEYNYSNYVFFIYASQYLLIKLINSIYFSIEKRVFANYDILFNIFELILFLVMPFIVIPIASAIAEFLKIHCNSYYNLLTGNR